MNRRTLIALLIAACVSACGAPASVGAAAPRPQEPAAIPADAHQIHWQRSLEDALALCKSTGRPLLVAMNMDGESASERITRENYRDPAFVASTRSFVCVIGSVFRHNLRDHGPNGERIPCPRLGEVTCGEHIALEPVLFDKYLGGERIAPRHALILPDGKKQFDEFLLYDLRELNQKLKDAQALAPAPAPLEPEVLGPRARSNRGRLAYEDALWNAMDVGARLSELGRDGDSGAIEALGRMAVLAERSEPRFGESVASTALALKLGPQYASILRQRTGALGKHLATLARIDGGSRETRTLLLAHLALVPEARDAALAALRIVLPLEDLARIEKKLAECGGPYKSGLLLAYAQGEAHKGSSPDERAASDPATLEQQLEQAGEALQKQAGDARAKAQFGRASLALARARVEAGMTRDVPLLLQDADHWLAEAAAQLAGDVQIALDRAETSYRLSDFAGEERHARNALEHGPTPPSLASGRTRVVSELGASRELRETLRWVGDASARNAAARAWSDPAEELAGILRGANALGLVVLAREAGESDWLGLASFHGLLGLSELELQYLEVGILRLPEAQGLRSALADACWRIGDLERLTAAAAKSTQADRSSGAAQWYLGCAWILRAESSRRAERADDAIQQYTRALPAFESCAKLMPDSAENCKRQRALCLLGQGFAHLLADRRAEAAECLADALTITPAVNGVRDGLDREAIDLLDQSLEWRASGPSTVDARALLARLEKVDPGNVFWPRALSDSELREARRAQHRNAPEEELHYATIATEAAGKARALSDDEETRRAYALPLSLCAEHWLAKGELVWAEPALRELALLLGLEAPAKGDSSHWKELAAAVRAKLGEAAPVARPGR